LVKATSGWKDEFVIKKEKGNICMSRTIKVSIQRTLSLKDVQRTFSLYMRVCVCVCGYATENGFHNADDGKQKN